LGDAVPKITDFGLAKRLDLPGRTQTGAIMGTPSYMPPEQARGQSEKIGPVSDVYALAAVLYEMLTGRPPFKGTTPYDTILQLCTDDPVAPTQLQPKLSHDLETICLKGLHKDPSRRYASAVELADDLGRFLRHEPIRARPVSSWERTVKWARREPLKVALLAAGLAALVFTLFYFRAEAKLAIAERDRVQREKDDLERSKKIEDTGRSLWDQAKEAEAAADLARAQNREATAADLFRTAASLYDQAFATLKTAPDDELLPLIRERRQRVEAAQQEQTTREQARANGERFLKDVFAVEFLVLNHSGNDLQARRSRIRRLAPAALGRLNLNLPCSPQEAVRALQAYRQQCAPERFEPIAAGWFEILLTWAEAEAGSGADDKVEDPVGRARRALELLDVAGALGQAANLAPSPIFHLRRSRYLAQAGDDQGARAEAARAAGMTPRMALDHFLVALEAYQQGRFQEVPRLCDQVLRLQPGYFWAHYLRALCHLKKHEWSQAKAELLACLGARSDLPWPYLSLASARVGLKEFAEAQEDYKTALRLFDDDPLGRYMALTNRATLWIALERWPEAQDDLRQAIALRPGAPEAHVNLGELHRRRKEWSQAIRALDQAIACQPTSPALYHTRARVYLESKDLASARRDLKQTIALEPDGSRSERLVSALVELGSLKHRSGEYEPALADVERALRIAPRYLPALSQRAETLIALKRFPDAGQALDRCLERDRNDREVWKARGFVHTQLREPAGAIKAYTQALLLEDDDDLRNRRGWAYLATGAMLLALDDFEAVLAQNGQHSEALCGRGQVRARLGKLDDAVADADEAVRLGPRTPPLLLGAACIHARAALGLGGQPSTRHTQSVERAVQLIDDALRRVRPEERRAFWENHVRKERAFAPLWGNARMVQLARLYAR
jgi:tetratricopeptide (TPR) repeat protein